MRKVLQHVQLHVEIAFGLLGAILDGHLEYDRSGRRQYGAVLGHEALAHRPLIVNIIHEPQSATHQGILV